MAPAASPSPSRLAIESRISGMLSVVGDGDNGVRVPPTVDRALADAIVRPVSDIGLAERLGTEPLEALYAGG